MYRNNELEKLNIVNLFTKKGGIKPHINGKLDINTLFKKKSDIENNYSFNPHSLLDNITEKRKKLNDCYFRIYESCCETIKSANNLGLTDIFYDVPTFVIECSDYTPTECINKLQEKLTQNKITSLKMSRTKIFITWYELEKKLSPEKNIENNNNENSN